MTTVDVRRIVLVRSRRLTKSERGSERSAVGYFRLIRPSLHFRSELWTRVVISNTTRDRRGRTKRKGLRKRIVVGEASKPCSTTSFVDKLIGKLRVA
jgi:hypothetical protein